MKTMLIASIAALGFFRCGVHWPKGGTVVALDDFTDAQWERLAADPNLRVTDAPDGLTPQISEEDLRAALKAAIAKLEPEDFGQNGKPKVGALRKHLPEGGKGITSTLVDEVWAELSPKKAD